MWVRISTAVLPEILGTFWNVEAKFLYFTQINYILVVSKFFIFGMSFW